MMELRLASLYRYPVKGLSPERLGAVSLAQGQALPFDRAYAIENGPSGFDPAAPAYFPKTRFLMLQRDERLAALDTSFDEETQVLTIREGGREMCRGDLREADGRAAVERFFAAFCADALRGPPRVLQGNRHSFSDVASKVVSIINLASVAALEAAVDAPVDPLRFRANLYVTGWPAWREWDFLGQTITVGHARLVVEKRIKRCAAIDVDPRTGARDRALPRALMRYFGHTDCGVYARVTEGARIQEGDRLRA